MVGTALQIIRWMTEVKDDKKEFEVKEHHAKRTLSQNGAYWSILTQVAQKLKMSKAELHNRMLRRYGYPLYVNGSLSTTYLPDDDATENKVLQLETLHLKPISQVLSGSKGQTLRTYIILRGSSDYTTLEMSALLDGMIDEAKQVGVPTLSPSEIAEIKAHERRMEKNSNVQVSRSK